MTVLDIPAAEYHDQTFGDVPLFSSSIAHILATRSPAHAWEAHPRLNPNFTREEEAKFDLGNAAHSILLDGRSVDDVIFTVHADSWRTNDAKAAREHGRDLGKVPLLAGQRDAVEEMVEAVRAKLATHNAEPAPLADGKPEQTLLWDEHGVACKARVDWLRDDLATIDDVKTTGRSANPEAFERALYDHGYHIQAALYLRAVERLYGTRPTWRWIVVETSAPYEFSVVTPAADVLVMGDAEVDRALDIWARCLESGVWPGYPRDVVVAELPGWIESRFMARQAREEMAA